MSSNLCIGMTLYPANAMQYLLTAETIIGDAAVI
jgi:hypothetical protein